jgi:hypothetical protein
MFPPDPGAAPSPPFRGRAALLTPFGAGGPAQRWGTNRNSSWVEPKVRIHLPPAESQVRTCRIDPGPPRMGQRDNRRCGRGTHTRPGRAGCKMSGASAVSQTPARRAQPNIGLPANRRAGTAGSRARRRPCRSPRRVRNADRARSPAPEDVAPQVLALPTTSTSRRRADRGRRRADHWSGGQPSGRFRQPATPAR